MTDWKSALFIPISLTLMVALAGCEPAATGPQPQVETTQGGLPEPAAEDSSEPAEEPLLLENEPLLLLDDAPAVEATRGSVADNSRCFVCHVNYMQEEIAVTHARANIGCADCHGPSDDHIADESWASGGNGTAPDIMYPQPKINPACMACHPREKIEAPQHEVIFVEPRARQVCTDCHGSHRLPQRRCK
jgi:hypothetical protein